MKTIKKLSIALLLSISSLQMINTMEGPVEGPRMAKAPKFEPTLSTIPEGEVEEENDGEKEAEKSAGSSGMSEAEKSADKSADQKGDDKGSSTSVTDGNEGGSEEGGLSFEEDSNPSEKQPAVIPSKAAALLGIDPVTAEEITSGDAVERQTKSLGQKIRDVFTKIGKGIASPFKALGKLMSDGFNRMKRLFTRNNSKLPEAEQLSPSDLNAMAESATIQAALKARLEAGTPMTAEEAEQMKQTFKESLKTRQTREGEEGLSSSHLDMLNEMIDTNVDALQESLQKNADAAARKKNLLDGLLGEDGDSSGLFDGPDQPLTSRGSSVFEEGEDGNPVTVENKSTPNPALFEGEGEATTTTTTSRQMSPEEAELDRRQKFINTLASSYESLSPEKQSDLISSLQKSANNELESKTAQKAKDAGKNTASAKMTRAARKELITSYRKALEGTGLTMNRNGKIIRAS